VAFLYSPDNAQYVVKVAYRKGDPKFLLEFLRTHQPNPELADLIDAASKKMRRDIKAR
jgi:hypothetical protein